MTSCPEGCGLCCEQISLSDAALEKVFGPDPSQSYDAQFIREHLHFLRRTTLGQLSAQYPPDVAQRQTTLFACDVFDPVTKRCTDYHHRPLMCSRYPWYGRDPVETDRRGSPVNDLTCVFQADIGPRRVLPIVAVT